MGSASASLGNITLVTPGDDMAVSSQESVGGSEAPGVPATAPLAPAVLVPAPLAHAALAPAPLAHAALAPAPLAHAALAPAAFAPAALVPAALAPAPLTPAALMPLQWPADTDLLLSAANRIMLTIQHPVMHAVFQDSFDRIHVALLFGNAFPDVYETTEMIRGSLVDVAEANEHATNIHQCLLGDTDYTINMSHLVSLWTHKAMLLTFFSASCTCSPSSWGSQGSLCGTDSVRFHVAWFKRVNIRVCQQAAVELQLYFPAGIKCKSNTSSKFWLISCRAIHGVMSLTGLVHIETDGSSMLCAISTLLEGTTHLHVISMSNFLSITTLMGGRCVRCLSPWLHLLRQR